MDAFGSLAPQIDPLTGVQAPSDQAQGKFNRTADAIVAALRNWIETPGRAMREGITTDQAADWAAPTALGMIAAPGVPAGAVGSARRYFKWNPLDDAEAYKQLALERRNEGGGGVGRSYKTQDAKDKAQGRTESDLALDKTLYGWRDANSRALDDFRAATAEYRPQEIPTEPDPFGAHPNDWPMSPGETPNIPSRDITAKQQMSLAELLSKYGLAGLIGAGGTAGNDAFGSLAPQVQ